MHETPAAALPGARRQTPAASVKGQHGFVVYTLGATRHRWVTIQCSKHRWPRDIRDWWNCCSSPPWIVAAQHAKWDCRSSFPAWRCTPSA